MKQWSQQIQKPYFDIWQKRFENFSFGHLSTVNQNQTCWTIYSHSYSDDFEGTLKIAWVIAARKIPQFFFSKKILT